MPLIPALRRQRQVDFCEFKVILVCRVSSITARAIQESPVLINNNKSQNTTNTGGNHSSKGAHICSPSTGKWRQKNRQSGVQIQA